MFLTSDKRPPSFVDRDASVKSESVGIRKFEMNGCRPAHSSCIVKHVDQAATRYIAESAKRGAAEVLQQQVSSHDHGHHSVLMHS